MTPFSHRSSGEPPNQGYNDPPYTPNDTQFLSQQGPPPLGYCAQGPDETQTQETGYLQGLEGSGGGLYTDALYEDRNSAQSSNRQHFQQMTAYSTNRINRFGQSPYSGLPHSSYPQTIDANLAEDDPDPNRYHGRRFLTTDNMASSYDSVPLQTYSNRQASSFRADIGPYPPYHGAEVGLPNETRFPLSGNSFASNNTIAYPAPQATNDGQDLASVYMRQPLEHQPSGTSNCVSREPGQVSLDSVYTEPWSPFQPVNANQSPQHPGQPWIIGRPEISDPTQSICSGGINHSSYTMPEGVTTPLSSMNMSNGHMRVSTITERAHHPQLPEVGYQARGAEPHYTALDDAPSSPFQFILQRSATPQVGVPPSWDEYSQWELGPCSAPPMTRKPSSANSCNTDASSHGRPPADDPYVLYCETIGCPAFFTGVHRRGNLGRHTRQQHKSGKLYVCKDDTCAREFKRSDARVKHYRKHHPELASEYVPRPQARRLQGDQDVYLSNISSWT
jgi:hypothetical protein